MNNVFTDIETFFCDDEAFINQVRSEIMATVDAECGNVKAPSNYKDAIKIEEWMATEGAKKINAIRADAEVQIDDKIRATALDGALGCIAVIGYAIDDAPAEVIYEDSTTPAAFEADVIRAFYAALSEQFGARNRLSPRFVGHNITGFDLRFLFQRSVVLGICPPPFIPFHAKPWDDSVFDTMIKWAGVGQRVKLDKICKALGLPGKQGFDGSQVGEAIRAGRIKDVAAYCRDVDVVQTRQVYKRLTFTDLLAA
jgi:hypothetical protein